jgi:UDP-N-acetyl-2-amino-2-deoxyglucuronate dehydrogenase
MTSFALIGAGGYIAPRHMKAMKAVGGDLKVAFDPNDSVGVIDSYYPDAHFFVEFERFDRHIDKLRRRGEQIDYVTVCSPNYMHDAHCRFGLRSGANVICEKPLVLNPWNIDGLAEIERATGRRVSTILQLRHHPSIIALREDVARSNHNHTVDLTYITSRGRWYHVSWKGDEAKSGGIATNIGMLIHVFGKVRLSVLHLRDLERMAGYLECERATVRWFLSVDKKDLPKGIPDTQTTYRSIVVDGREFEFSGGFTDLHTVSYEAILAGKGFNLEEVRPSVEVVSALRSAPISIGNGEQHPWLYGRKI